RILPSGGWREQAAIGLIFGGAIGNLIDRTRFGAVVDFVDVYVRDWHWPAFNVADSAITVGVAALALARMFERWPARGAWAVTVLTVEPASAGVRLDRWLSERLTDLSRARLQALIRGGLVRIDGATSKAAHRLRGGERIEIEVPPAVEETLVP